MTPEILNEFQTEAHRQFIASLKIPLEFTVLAFSDREIKTAGLPGDFPVLNRFHTLRAEPAIMWESGTLPYLKLKDEIREYAKATAESLSRLVPDGAKLLLKEAVLEFRTAKVESKVMDGLVFRIVFTWTRDERNAVAAEKLAIPRGRIDDDSLDPGPFRPGKP